MKVNSEKNDRLFPCDMTKPLKLPYFSRDDPHIQLQWLNFKLYFCFVNGIVFQKENIVEGEKLTIRSMYFSLKNVIVSVKIIRFFVKWMTGKDNEYILSACTQMYRISINSTRASVIKAAAIILLAANPSDLRNKSRG